MIRLVIKGSPESSLVEFVTTVFAYKSIRLFKLTFMANIKCFFFRFKNRELQIMRRLDHCNIVSLLYFFYTSGEKKVA